MIEIFIKIILFSILLLYTLGSVFYIPFGYFLRLINSNYQLKIVQKIFYGFLCISNFFMSRIITLEGENILTNDNYLIISNHVNEYDLTVFSYLFKDTSTLGSLKFIMKSEMRNIPIIYQFLDLLDFLAIERNYEKDELSIRNYCKNRKEMNMIIFPEGTTICDETILKSNTFRTGKELNPLKFVLSPKYRGLDIIIKELKDSHIKSLLDLTFTYPDCEQPDLFSMLFTNKKYKIKFDMKIDNINSITDTRSFLESRWALKENWVNRAVKGNEKWYNNK